MSELVESLDGRSCEMLTLLIETHIATGEPVGSRAIATLSREGLSSATIRHIFAELEEAGFLEQPHTSAGRIPSDKGYRFYVNHLLDQPEISEKGDTQAAPAFLVSELGYQELAVPQFNLVSTDRAEDLLAHASQLLSRYSDSVGIVIGAAPAQSIIKHVDFVRLNEERILVITVTQTGIVQDRLIRLDEDLSQDELNSTARYLNENFAGLSLAAMRNELIKRLTEERALYDRLLQNALMLCDSGLNQAENGNPEVYIEGTYNMVAKRDFSDREKIRELLRVFEEKSRLIKILNECIEPNVQSALTLAHPFGIRIGAENSLPSLRGCTVITSHYTIGDQVSGSLGVVGPVRMEYARMIGIVHAIARNLEQALAAMPARAS